MGINYKIPVAIAKIFPEVSELIITEVIMGKLTQKKAKEIMKHGEVHGKPLTEKQRGFIGARASDRPIKRKKR